MQEDDDDIVAELRQRSQETVETVFAGLAILSVGAGLAARHYAAGLGIADMQPEAIASSFLCMGVCYAATMIVWDWLYGARP